MTLPEPISTIDNWDALDAFFQAIKDRGEKVTGSRFINRGTEERPDWVWVIFVKGTGHGTEQ